MLGSTLSLSEIPRIKLARRDFSSSECDRQPATLSSGSGFPDWPPGAPKRSGCGIGDLSVFFLPSLKEIKGEAMQKGRRGSDKRLLSACYLWNLDSIRATPVRIGSTRSQQGFHKDKKKKENWSEGIPKPTPQGCACSESAHHQQEMPLDVFLAPHSLRLINCNWPLWKGKGQSRREFC